MTQRDDPRQLGDRTGQILRLLIRTYITSGEPVGSGTLSRNIEGKLSPATIRNIMAELEDSGYLTHPHTSAGRVPSEKELASYLAEAGFGQIVVKVAPVEMARIAAAAGAARLPESRPTVPQPYWVKSVRDGVGVDENITCVFP